MDRKRYTIARIFAEDHWERNCGLTDEVVKVNARTVVVDLDVDGYQDMLTDADYYWDMRDEMSWDSLCQSAKRVMAALLKAGPPDGFEVVRRGISYVTVPMRQEVSA